MKKLLAFVLVFWAISAFAQSEEKLEPAQRKPAYTVGLADGEAYVFSQFSRLVNGREGLFRAEGVICSNGSGSNLDSHGTEAEWKKMGEDVDCLETFSAVMKAEPDRYVLVEDTVKSVNSAGPSSAKVAEQPIPLQLLGKTIEVRNPMTRADVRVALSSIINEEPSVDTAERLQYDVVLLPDNAPVAIIFDFDSKSVVSGVMLDSFLKKQNPVGVRLVDWLRSNAQKPEVRKKGTSIWTFGGYKIEHVEGGSGEDSVYRVTLTRSKRSSL